MQKPISVFPTNSFVHKFKNNILSYFDYPNFELSPIMPDTQINHFVENASQNKLTVAIQYNTEDNIEQVEGIISSAYSKESIVVHSSKNQLYYMISLEDIRHIKIY